MGPLFATYEEAVEMIISVLRSISKVQLGEHELRHMRPLLAKALRADTLGGVHRLNFLGNKDKLRDAIQGRGLQTTRITYELLFAKTWTIIELYV